MYANQQQQIPKTKIIGTKPIVDMMWKFAYIFSVFIFINNFLTALCKNVIIDHVRPSKEEAYSETVSFARIAIEK